MAGHSSLRRFARAPFDPRLSPGEWSNFAGCLPYISTSDWEDVLQLQLEDCFDKDFDRSVWVADVGPAKGEGRSCLAGDGICQIHAETTGPPGPGVGAYGGFATQRRFFQPNLRGNGLFEITLADYTNGGAHLNRYLAPDGSGSEVEDPDLGVYLMGFCLSIGSFRGLVGSETNRERDRIVQIHCDWWSRSGLWFWLNRNALEEDKERYQIWGTEKDVAAGYASIRCPVVTLPGNSVALAIRRNPLGFDRPANHRWGIGLAADGNRLYWTLDGTTVDTQNITGFFDSSAGCVAEGAYVTVVGGGGYARNTWTVADARIYAG